MFGKKKRGQKQKFSAPPKEGKRKRLGGTMSPLFGMTPKKPEMDPKPASPRAQKAASAGIRRRLADKLI